MSCTSFLVARKFTGPKNIFRKAPANPTVVQNDIIAEKDKTQEQDQAQNSSNYHVSCSGAAMQHHHW
jgi:hypothetical protein